MLVCEDSLCPGKLPDVSGPGLGKAGRYRMVSEPTLTVSRARTGVNARECGWARGSADATGMWTGAWLPEADLERTPKISVLGLEQFRDG